MKTSTISEFKAHISENLRNVRQGEHYVILDRDIPVAEVIPITSPEKARRILPAKKPYQIPLGPSVHISADALDYLRQDRGDH